MMFTPHATPDSSLYRTSEHDENDEPTARADGPESAGTPDTAAPVRNYLLAIRAKRFIIAALTLGAAVAFVISIVVGPFDVSLGQLWQAVTSPNSVPSNIRTVVWDLRLPGSVMAVLIGCALALSGAQMQTILDNPLAEPFTLGISAAAAFGGAASIVLGWTVVTSPQFNLAVIAWLASLVAVAIVAGASVWRGAGADTMILLGIALVFLFQALLALLQYRASTEALQQIVFWTMGSLQRATWLSDAIIATALLIAIPFTVKNNWALTMLRLGDDRAAALGVNTRRLRITTLVVASLLAASAVAFAGIIGFIGLVGPHIARIVVGENFRYFAPASMAAGALLLAGAHAVSITIIPGVAVPIGIITALIGVPFFVLIIFSRRRAR